MNILSSVPSITLVILITAPFSTVRINCVPEGTVPEGTVPEGTVPEGTVPEGTVIHTYMCTRVQ